MARYPEGKKVSVYFDPGDPKSSLLDPNPGGIAAHVVLIFTVLVGIFLLSVPLIPILAGEVELIDILRWPHGG